jgi:hypothetical protein
VEKLLEHVEGFARREGCGFVALACGRERTEALRFYEERMGVRETGLLHAEGPTLMLFRRILAYGTRKRAGVALVGDWPAGSNGCLAC